MSETTTKVATRQPRTPARQRTLRVLLAELPGLAPALVRITPERGEAVSYWIVPLRTDYGLGWRLDKDDEQPGSGYNVLLEGEQGQETATCDCRGYLAHSHCKHSAAVAYLFGSGQLAPPPVDHRPTDAERDGGYKPDSQHGIPEGF